MILAVCDAFTVDKDHGSFHGVLEYLDILLPGRSDVVLWAHAVGICCWHMLTACTRHVVTQLPT